MSGPSPARIGGIGLIGVAVVAAVIGLVTLGTGGSDGGGDSAAAPTETVAPVAPATPDTNEVPLPSFAPTPTAAAPTTTPAPVAPPVVAADAGGGAGAGASAPTLPLRIYNNSTISGLAATAAADFQRGGWTVADTTNYPDGVIPTSTVYYRPGTAEQASAQRLADEFGLRVEPRFQGIQDASPGLIVIVTRDFKGA